MLALAGEAESIETAAASLSGHVNRLEIFTDKLANMTDPGSADNAPMLTELVDVVATAKAGFNAGSSLASAATDTTMLETATKLFAVVKRNATLHCKNLCNLFAPCLSQMA